MIPINDFLQLASNFSSFVINSTKAKISTFSSPAQQKIANFIVGIFSAIQASLGLNDFKFKAKRLNPDDLGKPIPSPINLEKKRENGSNELEMAKKTNREGQLGVDGKLNGLGKKTYPSGIIEEGVFLNDQLHGEGSRTHNDGRVSKGTFVQGFMNSAVLGKNAINSLEETAPSFEEVKARQREEFIQAIGDYQLIDERTGSQLSPAQLKQEVSNFVGTGGVKTLHEGCRESTEARKKFIEFVFNRLYTSNEETITKGPIGIKELLGADGLKLYKAALKEEYASEVFRDAVFHTSSQTIPGEKQQSVLLIVGGCSASGKSFTTQNILADLFKTNNGSQLEEKNETQQNKEIRAKGNKVVSIDGGIERNLSQVTQLLKLVAEKQGRQGIKGLHSNGGNLKKIKSKVYAAVKENKDISVVLPLTFARIGALRKGGKLVSAVTGTVKKLVNLANESERKFVFADIQPLSAEKEKEEDFASSVFVMGNKRAWAPIGSKTDEFKPNNTKIPFESKDYNPKWRNAGLRGTQIAKKAALRIAKQKGLKTSQYIIGSDLVACMPGKSIGQFEKLTMAKAAQEDLSKAFIISNRYKQLWDDLSDANLTPIIPLSEEIVANLKKCRDENNFDEFRKLCYKHLPSELKEEKVN